MEEASTRGGPASTTSTTSPRYIHLVRGGRDKLVFADNPEGHGLARQLLADKMAESLSRVRTVRLGMAGLFLLAGSTTAVAAAAALWLRSPAKDQDQERPAVYTHDRPDKQGPTGGHRPGMLRCPRQ